MEVRLTPAQQELVRHAVESGRLSAEEDAVTEALAIWEERERRRLEILLALDRAEASLARGERRTINTDNDAAKLVDDVIRRATSPQTEGKDLR